MLFQNMIVAAGKPKLGMFLAVGAGVANVLLDILFVGVVSLIIFALSMILGSPLISIFLAKGTAVYSIERQGFKIFTISFLFCGFNIFASAMFTALSNGKVSATTSLLRTLVFITAALLILPIIWGIIGIWFAAPLAEVLTMFICVGLVLKERSKTNNN